MNERDLKHLRAAIRIAQQARDHGNHPFGSLLVDENGDILLEAENTVNTDRDSTAHAETNLVRKASRAYSAQALSKCTLYSSTEPCPMCAGAIFWSGIGRVVYALSEQGLYSLTNNSSDKLLLSCREVLGHGARPTKVIGPAIEDEARKVHEGFWE